MSCLSWCPCNVSGAFQVFTSTVVIMCVYTHIHTQSYMHMCIHTHTHTCAHRHIYIHTHKVLVLSTSFNNSGENEWQIILQNSSNQTQMKVTTNLITTPLFVHSTHMYTATHSQPFTSLLIPQILGSSVISWKYVFGWHLFSGSWANPCNGWQMCRIPWWSQSNRGGGWGGERWPGPPPSQSC